MNIIVQKYGGTSVENKEKLEKVCENIISYKDRTNKNEMSLENNVNMINQAKEVSF